jgi:hypothetical protein
MGRHSLYRGGLIADDLIVIIMQETKRFLSVTLAAVTGYRVNPSGFARRLDPAGHVTSLNSLISLTYRDSFGNMLAYPDSVPRWASDSLSSPQIRGMLNFVRFVFLAGHS